MPCRQPRRRWAPSAARTPLLLAGALGLVPAPSVLPLAVLLLVLSHALDHRLLRFLPLLFPSLSPSPRP